LSIILDVRKNRILYTKTSFIFMLTTIDGCIFDFVYFDVTERKAPYPRKVFVIYYHYS